MKEQEIFFFFFFLDSVKSSSTPGEMTIQIIGEFSTKITKATRFFNTTFLISQRKNNANHEFATKKITLEG